MSEATIESVTTDWQAHLLKPYSQYQEVQDFKVSIVL
jgi:hypothetical protein